MIIINQTKQAQAEGNVKPKRFFVSTVLVRWEHEKKKINSLMTMNLSTFPLFPIDKLITYPLCPSFSVFRSLVYFPASEIRTRWRKSETKSLLFLLLLLPSIMAEKWVEFTLEFMVAGKGGLQFECLPTGVTLEFGLKSLDGRLLRFRRWTFFNDAKLCTGRIWKGTIFSLAIGRLKRPFT